MYMTGDSEAWLSWCPLQVKQTPPRVTGAGAIFWASCVYFPSLRTAAGTTCASNSPTHEPGSPLWFFFHCRCYYYCCCLEAKRRAVRCLVYHQVSCASAAATTTATAALEVIKPGAPYVPRAVITLHPRRERDRERESLGLSPVTKIKI